MIGSAASSHGMQIHKLVEGSSAAALNANANLIYRLANMVPTPAHVHARISALHSTNVTYLGVSMRFREAINLMLKTKEITFEQAHYIESLIWHRAMALNGGAIDAAWELSLLH